MEDRRKIVIPVQPETPHFDAEETLLSARPVVPITHAEPLQDFGGPQAPARAPFYRRSLFLPLVVIAAVSMGLAAGLAIARYRYLQRGASPVVAQPAQAPAAGDTRTTTAAATQTPKGDEQAQAPALPEVKIEEKTTADDDTSKEDEAKTATPGASKKSEDDSADRKTDKEDNARTAQPDTTREKKRKGEDADEPQDTPRAQRRERRVRDRNDEDVYLPRRIERASEQINRIREIFEGRPQQP